jgi:hypothetical protein
MPAEVSVYTKYAGFFVYKNNLIYDLSRKTTVCVELCDLLILLEHVKKVDDLEQ